MILTTAPYYIKLHIVIQVLLAKKAEGQQIPWIKTTYSPLTMSYIPVSDTGYVRLIVEGICVFLLVLLLILCYKTCVHLYRLRSRRKTLTTQAVRVEDGLHFSMTSDSRTRGKQLNAREVSTVLDTHNEADIALLTLHDMNPDLITDHPMDLDSMTTSNVNTSVMRRWFDI